VASFDGRRVAKELRMARRVSQPLGLSVVLVEGMNNPRLAYATLPDIVAT